MKVVYATDLHSDLKQYQELKQLIVDNSIELLLIGGDLLEYSRAPQEQLDFIEDFLIDFFREIPIPVLMINGNVEWTGALKRYEEMEKEGIVSLLRLRATQVDQLNIVGYCFSNPSPFLRKDFEKRDLKQDSYRADKPILTSTDLGQIIERKPEYLNQLPSIEEDLKDMTSGNDIWIMHAPPFGTKLDVIKNGQHVGSKAIRNLIEKLQPTVTLHGHIHESPYITKSWMDNIGETISINPGRGTSLHAVILDFNSSGKLKMAEHTVFGKGFF